MTKVLKLLHRCAGSIGKPTTNSQMVIRVLCFRYLMRKKLSLDFDIGTHTKTNMNFLVKMKNKNNENIL